MTGTATIDGTIAVVNTGTRSAGEVFDVLTAGTLSGTFSALTGGQLTGVHYVATYPAGQNLVRLQVVQDAVQPPSGGTPSIPTSARSGDTITCSPGTWTGNPTSFTFSWTRDGSTIAGQSTDQLALTDADVGHSIRCRVVATNGGGDSAPALSNTLVPAEALPANNTAPSIPGSAQEGDTIQCSPGSWSGNPSFTFQWLRDGVAIAGATSQSYTLTAADVGHAVSCRVTGTNGGGSANATSGTVTPTAKPVVTPTATPTPTPTPTSTPPPTPQEVKLADSTPKQVATALGLPAARKCLSQRNFRIRLKQPPGVAIASARVVVNGKRVKVRKVSGRFTARVDLRGLPRGRFTVKITVKTKSGLTLKGQRRYRTCVSGSRRGSSGPL